MAFSDKKEQPYLETDELGVAVRASLLQVGDGMLFPRNKAPNNAGLH